MISIVMPVHNTGVLLHESISSILSQTYEDWELILIDDYSDDDETIELLKEYEKKDSRIKMYQNVSTRGAGEARNEGLKIAKGQYLLFLDSDDIFEPEMIESLYLDAVKNDADMCICGYAAFRDDNREIITIASPKKKEGVTDRVFSMKELPERGLSFWNSGPWNKIYKREFLLRGNIRFQNLKSANDVYFSMMCAVKAQRIVYCGNEKPLHRYRTNQSRQISSNRDPMNFYRAIVKLLDEDDISKDPRMLKRVYAFAIVRMAGELRDSKDEEKNRYAYETFTRFLREHLSEDYFEVVRHNIYLSQYFHEADDEWVKRDLDYDAQLEQNRVTFLDAIHAEKWKSPVLWGYGKRGKAIERFWMNYVKRELYITDKNEKHFGERTSCGNQIISIKDALESADFIIASNEEIWKSLEGCKQRMILGEMYCAL